MKNAFYFILFHSILYFNAFYFFDNLHMYKKWLNLKDKFNFEIYNVTGWLTMNYNTHIA